MHVTGLLVRAILVMVLALALLPAANAQTGAPRNDRIVGYWVSSSGAQVTLSYTNDPNSFSVQVSDGSEYTAFWTSDSEFYYSIHNQLVYGTYDAGSDRVSLRDETNGWHATWTRR